MQTHDTTDFRDPLKTSGLDKPGQNAESPFAEALFGKDGKNKDNKTDKAEKDKSSEKPQSEKDKQEIKVLQEIVTKEQTDNLRAQEKLQAQSLLETRSEVVKALLATILTTIQNRETSQQPTVQVPEPVAQRIPELGKASDSVRNLQDQKALSAVLTQVEKPLYPTPITIPAQAIDKVATAAPVGKDKIIDQAARAQFPANDPVNALGRQLFQAQAYLNAGRTNEAKILLDPAKAAPNSFADWWGPISTANPKDQKVMLADKIAALSETVKTAPGQSLPVEIINSNFLNVMEANVASRRTGKILPVAVEASRRAVLEFVHKPGTFDYLVQGKEDTEIQPVVQSALTLMANGIAQSLPFTDRRYAIPQGNQAATEFSSIPKIVSDITYKQTEIATPPPAPAEAIPLPSAQSQTSPAETNGQTVPPTSPSEKVVTPPPEPRPTKSADLAMQGQDRLQSVVESLGIATVVLSNTFIETGAPNFAPAETPPFSMGVLNNLFNRNTFANANESYSKFNANSFRSDFLASSNANSDLKQAQFNAAVYSAPSVDYFRSAAPAVNDNSEIVVQSANIIHTNFNDYPVAINTRELNNGYSNLSIPNSFEAKHADPILLGGGSNLDGANNGVMATGPAQSKTSNSNFNNRLASSLTASSLSSSSSLMRGSNNNIRGASNAVLGAGNNSGASLGGGLFGGGGTGLPLWHCGFLSPLRSGNIAFGINQRTLRKEEEEEDKEQDKEEDREKSKAERELQERQLA